MRDLGLIERRRDGRRVFYSLADDHLGVLLRESLYHVDHARLSSGDGRVLAGGTTAAAMGTASMGSTEADGRGRDARSRI